MSYHCFDVTMAKIVSRGESTAAVITSCPQSADVQSVWMTVALIMTTLAILTTAITIGMGFLFCTKRKPEGSTGVESMPGNSEVLHFSTHNVSLHFN